MIFLTITVNYGLNSDLKYKLKKNPQNHDQKYVLELYKENM